ncbi:MAG: class I SAM-dependent methyltransferase [Acidobacteria bacterium]|nr:class I SAM-dependent methyltransferase [Acidobacteriota bacterium]
MNSSTKQLLASYPRSRPPLSEAHHGRYLKDYEENRHGRTLATGIVQKLESWMHRRVAAAQRPGDTVLEIGAGTLNHLAYESGFTRYDFVEPFEALWRQSPALHRTSSRFADIREVGESMRYHRIVSIAVLEHLTGLPAVLARAAMLLASDGLFQAGIPTEGGMLWGLAWRYGTGIPYRLRTGLDYKTLMRHEHVNSAREILALTRHFFDHVETARFPLPAEHLSFYTYLEARRPRLDRCRQYLEVLA